MLSGSASALSIIVKNEFCPDSGLVVSAPSKFHHQNRLGLAMRMHRLELGWAQERLAEIANVRR